MKSFFVGFYTRDDNPLPFSFSKVQSAAGVRNGTIKKYVTEIGRLGRKK